jgi:hypothetical protein
VFPGTAQQFLFKIIENEAQAFPFEASVFNYACATVMRGDIPAFAGMFEGNIFIEYFF